MDDGLVFDVGANNGDDTAYYLHRGHRTLARRALRGVPGLPWPLVFAALALALPGSLFGQTPSAAHGDVVWHWFGECAGRDSLVLDVSLDGQPIYTSTFPICQVRRGRKMPEPQQRFLSFKFRAVPRRFRAGTPGTEPELITGSIWETGGDRNAIQFGLQFALAAEQLVLLNTSHPARVDAATLTERVRGLKITTRPVRRKP